ncbi:MAG: hypothetical protein DDT26_02639 [Dehalococcoidia bacterium]|nr:hypothetical protein [Chloroflexota bacterium]
MASWMSDTPIAITSHRTAGLPMVASPGPSFPAAATTMCPAPTAFLVAVATSSLPIPSPCQAPKLMLITSAPFSIDHSMAESIHEVRLRASWQNILALSKDAPGATPLTPVITFRSPAAMPAICVPCPCKSSVVRSLVKSFDRMTFPSSRSG